MPFEPIIKGLSVDVAGYLLLHGCVKLLHAVVNLLIQLRKLNEALAKLILLCMLLSACCLRRLWTTYIW